MAKENKTADAEAPTRNLKQEGQDNIVVGHVYKEDNGDAEVIPYFLDFSAARVNYSGVGRSNEEQMRTSDFLNRFTYVGPVSSAAEEQKSSEARSAEQEEARRAEAKRAESGDPSRKTGV